MFTDMLALSNNGGGGLTPTFTMDNNVAVGSINTYPMKEGCFYVETVGGSYHCLGYVIDGVLTFAFGENSTYWDITYNETTEEITIPYNYTHAKGMICIFSEN